MFISVLGAFLKNLFLNKIVTYMFKPFVLSYVGQHSSIVSIQVVKDYEPTVPNNQHPSSMNISVLTLSERGLVFPGETGTLRYWPVCQILL